MEEGLKNKDQKTIEMTSMQSRLRSAWDFLKFALVAFIVVVPIRMYIAQPFIVEGASMYPTFEDGQYLIIDELSYNRGKIERGDVAVLHPPIDPRKYYIKRIIGLPNEEIAIKDGVVTIKNAAHPEGFTLNEPYLNKSTTSGTPLRDGTYQTLDKEYFVMGDNRDNSSDSRRWGVVPAKYLVGRAYMRLLPIDNISYLPGKYKEVE